MANSSEPLFFQDAVRTAPSSTQLPQHERADEVSDDDDELSLAFFRLANATLVGYRLTHSRGVAAQIVVKQDTSACGQHTGGIVWETSYLLANYLLSQKCRSLGETLEVGAGCGLLGLVLATAAAGNSSSRAGTTSLSDSKNVMVTLTETASVMPNLLENIERNASITRRGAVGRELDWTHVERDAARANLEAHTFDTIVGTDVIFTPILVEPLLRTLQFLAHDETVVFLCVQVRCPDSHQLLWKKASLYGWEVTDVSSELSSIPECAWGLQMEMILLRLTRIAPPTTSHDTGGHSNVGAARKRKSTTTDEKRKKR